MSEARVRDVLRVLCRIPIQRGQLVLYRLAIEFPKAGFTSTRIKEILGIDHAAHRGMMAALTVRINNTPHETSPETKPGLGLLFHQNWDGRENTYRPRTALLEAIDRLPKLKRLMERPIEEVVEAHTLYLQLPTEVHPTPPPRPVAPPPRPPKSAFAALQDALEKADLVYPTELVANLLLALQVKRFVILTGISGTGKTRIAQALAERFPVRRAIDTPEALGEQSASVTVMPYMLKYNRMILPQALAAQVPGLADLQRSGTLKTRWPGGSIELSVYADSAVQILFRGAMRRWFSETFQAGDPLSLRLDGPRDEPPDTLVFEPISTRARGEATVQNALVMAVRPDWTDHRGLLGSYNPLTRQYLPTPLLHLLLEAQDEVARANAEGGAPAPFFLVLDEMNLARVEHYFADFLSALESGEPLHLHDSREVEEGFSEAEQAMKPVPRRLGVPKNVFFIGTVNVDESTYLFSPKVLDRAFTLELNSVDLEGLTQTPERGGELSLDRWNGRLDPPVRPSRGDWQWLAQLEEGSLIAQVSAFHTLLARHNRHFGYRVATELARFVRLASEQAHDQGGAAWAALDLALLQKVLVKLHGTRNELSHILEMLLRFTLVGVEGGDDRSDLKHWQYLPEEGVVRRKDEASDIDAVFPRSAAKLWRMHERLKETGFTSWIE